MFNDNGYDRILYKCLLILVLLSIILEVNITLTLHGTSTMIVIYFFSIVFNILQVYFLTNKKSTLECSNTGMIIEKLIESNKNIKPHYQNIAKNNLLKRITSLSLIFFIKVSPSLPYECYRALPSLSNTISLYYIVRGHVEMHAATTREFQTQQT